MPRTKLPKIKTLENKLWKLCKEYVFARDKNRCQKCGKYVDSHPDRQPSHVCPKSRSYLLRFDHNNVKTLCASCHREWHDYPRRADWFDNKFPERAKYIDERENILFRTWRTEQGITKREWLNSWIEFYEKEKENGKAI